MSNSPESIEDPKELLGKIVEKNSITHYIDTVHNKKIAANQAIATLSDAHPSGAIHRF